jgi:hypothetical protein
MAVDIGLLYMHAVLDHEAATCIDVVIWDDWEVLNHGADVPALTLTCSRRTICVMAR